MTDIERVERLLVWLSQESPYAVTITVTTVDGDPPEFTVRTGESKGADEELLVAVTKCCDRASKLYGVACPTEAM